MVFAFPPERQKYPGNPACPVKCGSLFHRGSSCPKASLFLDFRKKGSNIVRKKGSKEIRKCWLK
jgi:hypothetical protein